MVRLLGIALIGAGLVLAILGIRAHDSTASAVTRFVSGSPTRQTVMLLTGAGASVLVGMALVVGPSLKRSKRSRRG